MEAGGEEGLTPPDCTICLEKLTTSLCALICGHVFHRACIGQWFRSGQQPANKRAGSKECPCCKRKCSMSQVLNLHYDGLPGKPPEVPQAGTGASSAVYLEPETDHLQREIAQLRQTLQQLQSAYCSCSQRLAAAQEQIDMNRDAVEDAVARHQADRRMLQEQIASLTYRHGTKERELAALKRQLNDSDARIEELEEEAEEATRKLEEAEANLASAMSTTEGAPISTLVRGFNIDWVRSQIKQGSTGEKTISDRFTFVGRRYDEAVQACKQAQGQAEELKRQVEVQRTQLFQLHAKVKALEAAPVNQQQGQHKPPSHQQQQAPPPASSSRPSEKAAPPGASHGVKRKAGDSSAAPAARRPFVMRNELAPLGTHALNKKPAVSSSSSAAIPAPPGRSFFNPSGKASAGSSSSSSSTAAPSAAPPRSLLLSVNNNGSFIKTGYDAMGKVQHFQAHAARHAAPPKKT